jgi:Protein of unknown function DUF262
VSQILEDIAGVLKTKVPTTGKGLAAFVRRANKKQADRALWEQFSLESRDYLIQAFRELRHRSIISFPPDCSATDALVTQVPDTEVYEQPPEGFQCANQSTNYNIITLVSMRERGQIRLPDFQRKFIWNKGLQQAFLESVLIGVPIQSLLFAVDEGTESRFVLDGHQRLSTLIAFYRGELSLGRAKVYSGFYYHELSELERNRFLHTVLDVKECHTSRDFWPYIFRRVNKSGVPLNDIEIRRALYDHELLNMLDDFTETNQYWIGLFGKNTRYKGLHSLLRAVALHYNYTSYGRPVTQFLDRFCNKLFLEQVQEPNRLQQHLHTIMMVLYHSVGKDAFRLEVKKPVNSGLVDVLVHAGLTILEKNQNISAADLTIQLASIKNVMLANEELRPLFSGDNSMRESVIQRLSAVDNLVG